MPTRRISDGLRRRCTMACENCKRRKERCDGSLPCRRCVTRRVAAQCQYSRLHRAPLSHRQNPGARLRQSSVSVAETSFDSPSNTRGQPPRQISTQSELCSSSFPNRTVWTPTLLVCDVQEGSIFFGDSANESFLRQIRRLVAQTLGSCPFVDEPVEYHAVDGISASLVGWNETRTPPAKPTPAQANYLVSWSMRATNGMLGVVRESDAQIEMAQWLEQADETPSLSAALSYLILAKGALSCPEDEDHLADAYFSYARYLTSLSPMDEPSLKCILCYTWIAFYQLGTGKRNAAYHSVGVAVRVAHAMGIHRTDLPGYLDVENHAFRERLWKALRKLDLFTSGSLGRPLCTNETRDTKVEQGYSSTIDITAILETILREVYLAFKMSKDFVVAMTKEHRLWATRIADGLKADGIEPAELVDGCERQPNLAFYNIKESYYWSIMLLTRPFLLERASTPTSNTGPRKFHTADHDEFPQVSQTDTALVYACVDSAVRTIDLLQCLLTSVDLPKRLPFIVNSAFGAALTLGVAIFADLGQVFPLQRNLQIALELLQKFQNHDPVAKHNRVAVEQLQSTCDKYVARRNRQMMESQSQLVSELFGRVHEEFPLLNQALDEMNVSWTEVVTRQLAPQSPIRPLSTVFVTDDSSLDLESGNTVGSLSHLALDSFQEPQLTDMGYVNNESYIDSFIFSSLD
ncbi:hypothetical protein B0J13DRAFT_445071 [Dactylonectria estremocensis]|uniref:Zn(2)-C6 fungal-type domain-containing protein n=1 Tax=Dactylonectria estremocensis TaxID=1079267 RepID=A0A9P9J453_9HYPO|nr:hypothetical protein B0J13DRAFT_445071 [Dactylonectria estremocensis]